MSVLPITMLVLLAVGMMCGLAAWGNEPGGSATTTAPATGPAGDVIARVSEPPAIDGDLSKPVWKSRAAMPVDFVHNKVGKRAETTPMAVRYAYDENYLYIAYETFDKNLVAQGTGRASGPETNPRDGAVIYAPPVKIDVVEFFIGFEDERFMWELHHNALNQFNDVYCIVPDPAWPVSKTTAAQFGIMFLNDEYLHDDGKHTLKTAVKLKPKADGSPGKVNDGKGDDTGYTGELRIPWKSLGVPNDWLRDGKVSPAGRELRILAVCQDGDLAERYHASVATNDAWFHKTAAVWTKFKLGK